jgi:hypothetical protein
VENDPQPTVSTRGPLGAPAAPSQNAASDDYQLCCLWPSFMKHNGPITHHRYQVKTRIRACALRSSRSAHFGSRLRSQTADWLVDSRGSAAAGDPPHIASSELVGVGTSDHQVVFGFVAHHANAHMNDSSQVPGRTRSHGEPPTKDRPGVCFCDHHLAS